MGRSHFLFERAKAVPGHNIIGIEWKGEWVRQARKRAVREKVANVHSIFGNAWQLVPYLFDQGSLSQIIVNFPDPWWKKRHSKRKVVNDAFVEVLISKLAVGGRIYLATDVQSLFEEYVQIFESDPRLINLAGKHMSLAENPLNARSHREKKCSSDNAPIYRAWLEKRTN